MFEDLDLSTITKIAEENFMPQPFVVGGAVRDFLFGQKKFEDIDITIFSKDSIRLAILFANQKNENFRIYKDRHVTVNHNGIAYDFGSNTIHESVKNWMIENDKDLTYAESFSRDFTINTMHMSFDGKIFDPCNGKEDIKNKILRTPVSANISLSNDPRRIFRGVYLSSKFDLKIHSDIESFCKNEYKDTVDSAFKTIEISKAIKFNPDLTISNLVSMNLLRTIPLSGAFKELLIEKNMILDYLG